MRYSDKIPTYSKCPGHVQRRIERIFARSLKLHPYPEGIRERIIWVHMMEDALRGLEADSINLPELSE